MTSHLLPAEFHHFPSCRESGLCITYQITRKRTTVRLSTLFRWQLVDNLFVIGMNTAIVEWIAWRKLSTHVNTANFVEKYFSRENSLLKIFY